MNISEAIIAKFFLLEGIRQHNAKTIDEILPHFKIARPELEKIIEDLYNQRLLSRLPGTQSYFLTREAILLAEEFCRSGEVHHGWPYLQKGEVEHKRI